MCSLLNGGALDFELRYGEVLVNCSLIGEIGSGEYGLHRDTLYRSPSLGTKAFLAHRYLHLLPAAETTDTPVYSLFGRRAPMLLAHDTTHQRPVFQAILGDVIQV